jgi:hypothetical protein
MPLVLAAGVLVEDCLSSSGPHAPFKTFQGFFLSRPQLLLILKFILLHKNLLIYEVTYLHFSRIPHNQGTLLFYPRIFAYVQSDLPPVFSYHKIYILKVIYHKFLRDFQTDTSFL